MKIQKYYEALCCGEKVPRKAKKAILGILMSRKDLKERIKNTTIINHHPYGKDSHYNFDYPDDDFCPYCGCSITVTDGNKAEYPEEYVKYFCLRCDKEISYFDNGEVWHAIMDFKED